MRVRGELLRLPDGMPVVRKEARSLMPIAYGNSGGYGRFLKRVPQPLIEEKPRPILCLNNGRVYETIKAAAVDVAGMEWNSAARSIEQALDGKQALARGKRWIWADQEPPVQMFETGRVYSNAFEAAKAMGATYLPSGAKKIRDAAAGKRRSAFARHWLPETDHVPVMCWDTERCYRSAAEATEALTSCQLKQKSRKEAAQAIKKAADRGGMAFGLQWILGARS